jgi:2-succinyl-5-enolpyruvyl-6-hydroxy-3-cyclohexene-1-carboxylate synthase
MKFPNRNVLWAEIVVDELARSGLRHAVVAPGSRSTPLAIAFMGHPEIAVHSVLDERSAAFFSLGIGFEGLPAAVLCTSGTAAANLYPAIIEANHSHVPLLVLTADRPPELRGSGANQTIDQLKMFSGQVRFFQEVTLPEAKPAPETIRALRSLTNRAYAHSMAPLAGPVHLNFPFRKPLEPTPVRGEGTVPREASPRTHQRPFVKVHYSRASLSEFELEALVADIQKTWRGLIVCGPGCPGGDFPKALARLTRQSGFPVFADPLSGIRFGPHISESSDLIFGAYETCLAAQALADWEAPQLILQFGQLPTSKALNDFLGALPGSSERIAIMPSGTWHDDQFTTSQLYWADPTLVCEQLSQHLDPVPMVDDAWLQAYRQVDQAFWRLVHFAGREQFFEGLILADVVDFLDEDHVLFVGSSLPIRHLDQFGAPRDVHVPVRANRGASGIDGTVSTGLGWSVASARPVVIALGDISLLHDLNALSLIRRLGIPAKIVLIQNDGGGIFHRLPVADFEPAFSELFLTPHGLDFKKVEALFDVPYTRTRVRSSFRTAYRKALRSKQAQIIEIPTDAREHDVMRSKIQAALDTSG